jgi:GntR family transcriptional regulator/MocR family aminotransferase
LPKTVSSFEFTLDTCPENQTLTGWLYGELRSAILEGRLAAGTRLPASRDFASQYGLSRGTVVSVFERLQAEGYVTSRVGFGTLVNRVTVVRPARQMSATPPAYIRRAISAHELPRPWVGLPFTKGIQPFRIGGPSTDAFPSKVWGQISARYARNFSSWVKTAGDRGGYRPLRDAVADYLRATRGVRCNSEQIVIVSGAQQALDLLARLLLKEHDQVWMEDPGYFGASVAFGNVGAEIIPVPVDEEGLSVSVGEKICPHARGVYLTPAHQFPLGMTMSLERRMAVLKWAKRTGAFVIEDDYDSEFRFEGKPVPSLQSLDNHSNVILIGTFSKTLFESLRLAYIVLPPSLVDCFLAFRYRTDFRNSNVDQAVLCEFIVEGHFARHMRRMRELYGSRLAALIDGGKQHLSGLLKISNVRAGLYTIGFVTNGMTSREAEKSAAGEGIEALGVDRYTFERTDPKGVVLGFAAYPEPAIGKAIIQLAKAFSRGTCRGRG